MKKGMNKGFLLTELLIVVAIIGVLSSIAYASLNISRKKARDTVRLSDMNQIQTALELYRFKYGKYPDGGDDDCLGWDIGYEPWDPNDTFIKPLVDKNLINAVPGDPQKLGNCYDSGYFYQRLPAGTGGAPASRGAYYILGVRDMESVASGSKHSQSPSWTYGPTEGVWTYTFQIFKSFEWITGKFEN